MLLTAIAYSPVYFSCGLLTKQFAENHRVAALEATFLVALVTLVFCIPISTAGITYGVFQQLRGRDTSLGTCLERGFFEPAAGGLGGVSASPSSRSERRS